MMSSAQVSDQRAVGSARTPMSITLAMATAAYLIFFFAALIIHAQQRNEFIPERSSLAAAVSNVVYGAPLGKVYSGVLARFLELDVPLEQSMAEAARREVPPGDLLGTTADGNGIGYMVVVDLSMRAFGTDVTSAVYGMLILMGISSLAFLFRFRERYAVIVVLYFTALTVMLFTPLTWIPPYIANFVIGGIRYFSLVAILPAFHLLLDCAETRAWGQIKLGRHFAPMAVQIVILVLAILVRNSAAPLIAAIAFGWLLVAWWNRHDALMTTRLLNKAACMVLVAAAFIGILVLSLSKDYLSAGRFSETVWHRIFVSLGWSPEWPFGNLREVYDCTGYGIQQLVSGPDDGNGICVFAVYATQHNIPFKLAAPLLYGREYDAALREAFFKILWMYPAQTLRTFFYYKPQLILSSLEQLADIKLKGVATTLILLLVASVGTLLLFAAVSPVAAANNNWMIAGGAALLAAFGMLPYIAVWAAPHTSGDLLFFSLFGLGLAATSAIETVRRRAFPPPLRKPEARRLNNAVG